MSRIVRWSPFNEMLNMQRQLDRMFDDVSRNLGENDWAEAGNWLALDVHENDDAYTVESELPGLSADDIHVNLHDNTLTISAETSAEESREGERSLIKERRYGKFQRSVRLPQAVDADKVEAHFENGVLQLTLPKREEVKPRQIEVKSSPILVNQN